MLKSIYDMRAGEVALHRRHLENTKQFYQSALDLPEIAGDVTISETARKIVLRVEEEIRVVEAIMNTLKPRVQ